MELLSPWGIIMKLNVSGLLDALAQLGALNQAMIDMSRATEGKADAHLDSKHRLMTIQNARFLESASNDLGLPLTEKSARLLAEHLEGIEQDADGGFHIGGFNQKHFANLYNDVSGRIRDEFDLMIAHVIHQNDVASYDDAAEIFGDEAIRKFPSLDYDFEEAGKCLALGRSTAAVFHSIRCLEAMLRSTAKCLGIPDPIKGADKNWSKMLQKIEAQIDALIGL